MSSMPRTAKDHQANWPLLRERHAECEKLMKRIAFQLDVHADVKRRSPPTGGTPATWATSPRKSAYDLAQLPGRPQARWLPERAGSTRTMARNHNS